MNIISYFKAKKLEYLYFPPENLNYFIFQIPLIGPLQYAGLYYVPNTIIADRTEILKNLFLKMLDDCKDEQQQGNGVIPFSGSGRPLLSPISYSPSDKHVCNTFLFSEHTAELQVHDRWFAIYDYL